MTVLRQGGSGRRHGQALRTGMRQVLLMAALLTATAYLSFKLGTHRQVRRSIREAAAAAPPPPRCAEQLANASAVLAPDRLQKPEQVDDLETEFRLPGDTLAERTYLMQLDEPARFIASPSILALPSGRLLVLYEKQAAWGVKAPETATKVLLASDDGGASWQHVGSPGPMHWPTIFQCASGVYIIGVQRHFSENNNVMVAKMLDEGGAEWSRPARVTSGLSVVMANTAVDASWGRVTKAFEVIPVKGKPVKASNITQDVTLHIDMGPERASWHAPPRSTVTVLDSQGFAVNTLVKVDYEPHPLFFRILALDHARNQLQLRMERFTLYWIDADVTIEAGALLAVGSGAHIYGGVDWVSMAMSADETADLTKPEAWVLTEPLGNPASTRVQDVAALFDAAFRPDYIVRKSIIGFHHDYISDTATALEAGFGSLYWMEGVVVRLQDRRGATGQLLTTLRVNNDLFCDMAALVALNDTSLREAAAAKGAEDDTLAGVIAKAADSAAAVGRRLMRQVLSGDEGGAAGRDPALEQSSRKAGSRVVSSKWRQAHSSDSSGVRRLLQQLQREARQRRLQQGQPQAGQQQQGEQQQEQQASAAQESAAEGQAQPSGEDAAQQAEQSGLPVMSGAAEDAAAEEAARQHPLTGHGADALPAQPAAPRLEREFLRFRNIPGLAIGHPAIIYDNATDLYWMASNMNRDSTRRWRQPWQPSLPKLHITPFSKCEVDRTTMGLYYSGNAVDWWPAGVLDYHLDFASHFTYPHMTVVGEDLLVVMRATAPVANVTATSKWYNNHNSNAVSFHRVRGFRRYANVQWATYEGQYTLRPRVMSSTS